MMKTTSTNNASTLNRRIVLGAAGMMLLALGALPILLSLPPAVIAPTVFTLAAILLGGLAIQGSKPTPSFTYRRTTANA